MSKFFAAVSCLVCMGCGNSLSKPLQNQQRFPVIVQLRQSSTAYSHAGLWVRKSFQYAINGYSASLTAADIAQLQSDPNVLRVAPRQYFTLATVQRNVGWNLDKIDQPGRGYDGQYSYNVDGTGVRVYTLDTGVQADHPEFQGRATAAADFSADANTPFENKDPSGHGTHVAGLIGSQTFGVAKNTHIMAVKVFDHTMGVASDETMISGLEWIIADHKSHPTPAVLNVSIQGDASDILDAALKSVADAGITVVVAAGNSNKDACQFSPSRSPEVFTVGAMMQGDQRAWFSNFGKCVALFAPGVKVQSTFFKSGTALLDGTSMAAPQTAGAAALTLQMHPTWTPKEVYAFLKSTAQKDSLIILEPSSPNRVLNVSWNASK